MNRERKRQQQQLNQLHQNSPTQSLPPSQPPPPPPPPNQPINGGDLNQNHSPNSNRGDGGGQYHNVNNVLLDPTTNEPIYPPSMPAGDSWV